MEILASRVLLRPVDTVAVQDFYRDVLKLGVAREFGSGDQPGVVFFLGSGTLEVSGTREPGPSTLVLWLQVRDVYAEVKRLEEQGVTVTREAREEFWG